MFNISSWHAKNVIFGENSKLEGILDKLLYNSLTIGIRHTWRFLKRLPKYIKLAWQQEDWDYEYLYDLIEMKLKEFQKAQENDDRHEGSWKYVRQIKVTLARLDRYRNWTNYYEYPMEDIKWVPCDNNCLRMEHTNEENEKQRLGAITFEQKNYDKFWKDFLKYHQHWWT